MGTSPRLRLFLVCACAFTAFAQVPHVPFSPKTYVAGEGCRWVLRDLGTLRMNAHFIAAPLPGEDRAQWLQSLRDYRTKVREGKTTPILAMNYDGVRAWLRMSELLARAYSLRPGDALRVTVEARWLEGNPELCAAFDMADRNNGVWRKWSGVIQSASIPKDKEWHDVQLDFVVPDFDVATQYLRPILGMDATHNKKAGKVELRNAQWDVDDAGSIQAIRKAVDALPPARLNRDNYDRHDFEWASTAYTCHFTFMYDRAIYDPKTGDYTLDALLDDGEREFGGYDALVLWQGYPRLGVDQRNQFDMYRNMPGGIDGLRDLVRKAHRRDVRIFIDYNPWDIGTRREPTSDEEALATLVTAIDADGIFLDTMSGSGAGLRKRIDAAKRGVVFEPEGHPAIDQLGLCNASWAQWLEDPAPPGLLQLKWIEPRHMQHFIRRWDHSHSDEIESAFFNGSGVLVWENVFGAYNPWTESDRRLWKRASIVLHQFSANFTSQDCEPFVPTLTPGLFANYWPGKNVSVYTLFNSVGPISDAPLISIPYSASSEFYDGISGRPLRAERDDSRIRLYGSIDRISAIVVANSAPIAPELSAFLDQMQKAVATPPAPNRNVSRPILEARPVDRTPLAAGPPTGMVLVKGGPFTMKLRHQRRECGCYPDPGTPEDRWSEFLTGTPHDGTIDHVIGPIDVNPFYIDETEVTNAQFHEFVVTTKYTPKRPENFLRHWPDGRMPGQIAELPVIYVDLDDARAYARWAGKRLPTEVEWQLAAQGTDGREWPWGKEFDPARCNTTGQLLPARSLPEGASPFGCLNMAGNVWEWTESERDDGHTRFAMIRGGSYFNAEGSGWYVQGGPQPCTSHAKFLLMWPGLDRCATVGFRCVRDSTAPVN